MKNPQICAPAKSPIENKGKNKKWVTCYSRDSLVEIAKSCNTSEYEMLSKLNRRIKREYYS